jgi:hypothetical protein
MLIRIIRNKIKNNLKVHRVVARRCERERKKAVEALQRARDFILIDMLQAIPNPEKTTTGADLDLQLREALISTNTDMIDLGLMDSIAEADCRMNPKVHKGDYNNIALQVDFIGFDTECDYLDVDDDADTGLFQL